MSDYQTANPTPIAAPADDLSGGRESSRGAIRPAEHPSFLSSETLTTGDEPSWDAGARNGWGGRLRSALPDSVFLLIS
jgi:hypothetical protein